ncbi:hypothetical protein QAD02_000825 [Eretmocerus hayati]|uniref:Uncharacterized protein n=1 Tax=Eretmocerus hayati TaxID=131215 RepID=A0ACC2NFX3_9HYME|nr:hypothetical protein QAD02_000825 [Eretmocerus hayati]
MDSVSHSLVWVENEPMEVFYSLILIIHYSSRITAEVPTIKLSSGYEIPSIAFFEWLIEPNDLEDTAIAASEIGYTHFAMNVILAGEKTIGRALTKIFQGGVKREDVFITDTTPPFGNRAADVEKYLKFSLKNIGLDYFDMYVFGEPWSALRDPTKDLSHNDFIFNANGTIALDFDADHITIWKALENQVKAGLVRSIGLLNFNERQVLRLINNSEIKPSFVATDAYLYNQQKSLRKVCAEHNIAVAVWEPLGCFPAGMEQNANKNYLSLPNPLNDPVVLEIAKKYGKRAEQILLRHLQQEGLILVIPGLSKPQRLKTVTDIFDFDLSEEELKQLDGLDMGENGRFIDDYHYPGIYEHPEFPFSTHS